MTPEQSREFNLIELELAGLNDLIIRRLAEQGYGHAAQIATACYYERSRELKESYEYEASIRRTLPKSAKPDAWPTVDQADLHLPSPNAPDCKVIGVVTRKGAALFDGDGYYVWDREQKRMDAIADEEGVTILKRRFERNPTEVA